MLMPFIDADGVRIRYELLGSGPLLVLTPGGRFAMDVPGLRPLADRLAAAYTVLLAFLLQFEQKGRDFPLERTPDTYDGPRVPPFHHGMDL